MKKGNLVFIIILLMVVGVTIFFLPDIYKIFQKSNGPKIVKQEKNNDVKEKLEPITMDSSIVKNLFYPIMHNDKYNSESYYQKDKFSVNDLSNNDILFNAFLDIYNGYIVDYKSVGCALNGKKFDATYLKSRIKNIIGKNVSYQLEDFSVPNINKDNKYIGLWKYDVNSNSYIYNGNCDKQKSNIKYYEIEKLYKVDNSDDLNTLYLYFNVGFVKEDNNKYTLYKDSNYQEEVSSGIIDNNQDVNSFDISGFKTYKYTYKKGLCSYDNYCFYEGEWIND